MQRNHSIGRTAIFVEADIGAIEVEVAIWLIAGLGIDGQPACKLPIDAATGSHFAIGQYGMIQPGNSMVATEIIAHSEICFLQSRPGIQSQVLIPFEFETRCRQNRIEHPVRLKFPADAAAGNDGKLSFYVNADANYELQIRIINIGAADLERHVEIGRARPESFAINAGGGFQSNEN